MSFDEGCRNGSAHGSYLAAHTVVIKGTQMWSGAAWTEYCDLDVMQMLGRAVCHSDCGSLDLTHWTDNFN